MNSTTLTQSKAGKKRTQSRIAERPLDNKKLEDFMGKLIGDFGAALSSGLSYIGVKLGLYRALAGAGPVTSAELARKTGTKERYIREWLINQAAGGYVEYDPATGRYVLPDEHAVPLTDENSPFFVAGGFYVIKAMLQAQERIAEAFRKGGGIRWGEHDPDLFIGTEHFFRPGYATHLVASWIPALTGIDARLKKGAKVADVGCGHGASTVIMAQAYPKSRFFGFDNHAPSVRWAKRSAAKAGVGARTRFQIADASRLAGKDYDLITYFDCFHDMGDPLGAAKRAFKVLAADGSVLLVEPMGGHAVEGNLNPIGRTYSAASTLCCTSNSLALKGPGLGAVAPDDALKQMFIKAGFRSFRRATETPFNRIFEARR